MSFQWNDHNGSFHPDSAMDFLPDAQLRAIQLQRLRSTIERAYGNVELVRTRMDALGVKPCDIRTLDDIRRMPFMVKNDLRDTYPYGLFACPLSEVVRLHASSGTTGKPIVVGYTQNDMDTWKNVVMRALASAGMHRGDIIQIAFGYGLFTGGLGLHGGAETLGATVIPISGGNSERQIMVMRDFGVTAFACTPSYFIHLIEYAAKMGVDMKTLPLRVGIFGAEPWSEEMRCYIQREANIKAFDIYGLSEIIGPGVGVECPCQNGLHIFEDHFLFEILDPETGDPVPDGESGELVITTLSKEAMPVIRYRTHDITHVIAEPCSCGRSLRRIARIARRSDDMLIIRGVNVFPSQIEAALLKVEKTLPHYQIIVRRDRDMDEMEIRIEVTAELFSDRVSEIERIAARLSHAVESTTGIHAKIRLVEPQTLERSEGKAKRVLDLRNLDTPKP
ncbi:MAG: phenylacetate--CoA ligase [Chthoniobacteraceae bacterium]|nr:phenylacetate--CoA ligase [Chthoniobacteraceae bacterium]